jgi:hypothetical protein
LGTKINRPNTDCAGIFQFISKGIGQKIQIKKQRNNLFNAIQDPQILIRGWIVVGFNTAKTNAALGHVIWRHFNGDTIAHQDSDLMFSHIPSNIGIYNVVGVIQSNFKLLIGQTFYNNSTALYGCFFCHILFF